MNSTKVFFLLLITLAFQTSFAQKDGYWDKTRATTEEVTVSARNRIIIKTQDFPEGTTEVVFRITLLDKNQQMAGSLVSVLKSIPDPTGISQGSAGAVFILSKISGDDKCKYAVFSTADLASKYKENGYNIVERKRGRSTMPKVTKKKENETDKEKIKRLEEENLYLKAELEYSKKLRAVVQARKNQQQKKK